MTAPDIASASRDLRIRIERPDQPDVRALIDALDAYQKPLYPPESHHGIDIDAPDGVGADGFPAGRRREPTVLRIGVNADSLSTWFRPIFREAAGWDDIVLRIEVADQGNALPLLTSGEVLGTITSAGAGGYGTRVEELGTMRYVAVATRGLLAKYGIGASVDRGSAPTGSRDPGAEADLASLPMVNFGRDDDLQLDLLKHAGIQATPPMSVVPSSWEFAAAVEAGVGWGLIPVMQLDSMSKDLVPIAANPNVDVPLYWHRWTLASEKLGRLTDALHRAAELMR